VYNPNNMQARLSFEEELLHCMCESAVPVVFKFGLSLNSIAGETIDEIFVYIPDD